MRIVLVSPEQKSLTGQPMYVQRLALALQILGHDVYCYDKSNITSGHFDLAVINDYYPEALDKISADKIYNFCHSMNDCDKPIEDERIDGYLFPREEVQHYWRMFDGIVMPIPIIPVKEKVIAPCTRDKQREPMLKDLLQRAENGEIELTLVGDEAGAELTYPSGVSVLEPVANHELLKLIREHDTVAGIHIGTVTLEAWFLNRKTIVYDLDGDWEYVEPYKDFRKKHDYLEVAKRYVSGKL